MTACGEGWADEIGHDETTHTHSCVKDDDGPHRHRCSCGAELWDDVLDRWHEIVDVDGEPARATWVGPRDEQDLDAFREVVRAVRRLNDPAGRRS